MSTQQVASASVLCAEEVLSLTIAQAREAGRNDLIGRLSDARHLLVGTPVTVHVVGGGQQGKSSLVKALTALASQPGRSGSPSAAPVVAGAMMVEAPAGRLALVERTTTMTGALLAAGEEGIARAHAVLFVAEASSELTRSEIAQLRRIQDLCPTIVLALTKIDANGRWREVLEHDKILLREAGVGAEALAVSVKPGLRCDDEISRAPGIATLLDLLGRIAADAERTSLRAASQGRLRRLAAPAAGKSSSGEARSWRSARAAPSRCGPQSCCRPRCTSSTHPPRRSRPISPPG